MRKSPSDTTQQQLNFGTCETSKQHRVPRPNCTEAEPTEKQKRINWLIRSNKRPCHQRWQRHPGPGRANGNREKQALKWAFVPSVLLLGIDHYKQLMSEEHQDFIFQAIAFDNAELLAELLAARPLLANCHDADGRTPLHHAAAGGHAKGAEILLGSGADVDAVAGPQDTVKTPLGLASAMGHCSVVQLLVENGADLFYVDSDGHSALQLAQMGGHDQVATLLIGIIERIYAEAEQKNQRLCAACVDGEVGPVLDILSDLGPKSIRKQILNGRYPGEQKSALFLAAENGRAEIVRALLTVQYHSIIFEPSGDTVLHAAIASQNVATVEQILHKFPFLMDAALLSAEYPAEELKFFAFRHDRANCSFGNGSGTNERCEEGYLFVCDLNAFDREGRSAFFLAVMEGHSEVVQLLAKFKLPISNGTRHRREMLRTEEKENLMEHPILFDGRVNGKTPLIVACANGSTEIVRILVEQCHVDVNYSPPMSGGAGESGVGALAEAANSGHLEVLRALFHQGAFDYGNRTLRGLLADDSGHSNAAEIVGLFLQQLAHHDNENCVSSARSPRQKKEHGQQQQQDHSRALPFVESLVNASNKVPLSDHLPSTKVCQLNWQSTGVRELRSEWMVDAALRLNPQIPRHLSKSLALNAISRIDLSSNQLCSVPHILFTHLHSLRSLDLSKNCILRLEMPPDGANWQMPSLDRLCLDENQLEELPKQLFSSVHFPRLCFLSANFNRLRRLPPSVWTAPRLRELHLANNLISELSAAALSQQELRRGCHLYRGTGTGGASAARISRQKQREAVDGRSTEMDEENQRQSRTMAKRRESPTQHQQSSSRRESRGVAAGEQQTTSKSQSTDTEEDNASATPRGAATNAATVVEMDIHRVNIWQEKIHLSNIDEDGPTVANEEATGDELAAQKGNGTTRSQSQLQLLNLAQNKFGRMPTCLACCCPRLAKLDLSSNSLSSLGPVGCLPSALRHLDVSKNQLVRLFGGENPAQLRQKLRFCEAQSEFGIAGAKMDGAGGGITAGNMPMPRHSRSRSKSVARSQRSLSVVRKSGGGVGRAEQLQNEQELLLSCCVHKSHCRFEALKTLNLAQNSLEFVDILLPMGGGPMDGGNNALFSGTVSSDGEKLFNWRENSELLKPYVLFPSLTNLDLSLNRIRQLPSTISLLGSLAMLNLANNVELDSLVPELGLLERLWTIGLSGCQLQAEEPALQAMVQAGSYKTGEVLAQLRQRLENSMPYPMLKLMLLGASSVGKSTLLQQIRLEGALSKKRGSQNDNWQRRRHSPITPPTTVSSSSSGRSNRARFTSQHRPPSTSTSAGTLSSSVCPLDVFEWVYEPAKVSSSTTTKSTTSSQHSAAAADAFQGPITFRVWDFDGIKQREYQSVQRCFFTRRCLFLLLWKVTDGDIALADLHDFLLAIQAQAPNSYVLIVGTHSDFVREQLHRFPRDYLSQMDKQIQERFILGADPEKNGLPRVLGSLYISCCSREDVRSLCALIYTCATEIRQFSRGGGPARQRLLAQKVPASFVLLEHIVATMSDEFRSVGKEPIMHFNEFWSLATDRLAQLEEQKEQQQDKKTSTTKPASGTLHFRGAQDFRQACLFLHENGVICYYDDTFLRDFVFLDPTWLCANLFGILSFAALRRCSFGSAGDAASSPPFVTVTSLSQMHQNSVIESVELYTALKRAVRHNLALLLSAGISRPSVEVSFNSHFHLFRQCVMNLLRKFELAMPFQYGRMSLLASCLPDEYVLRADYPGSKVLVRNKFDKLRIRWDAEKETAKERDFVPRKPTRPMTVKMSPIRNYLQHRRLSRAVATSIDNLNSTKLTEDNGTVQNEETNADLIKILAVDQCKEECLRRLYVMHYIPPGFWARLTTRLLDDERVGNVLTKMFLISRASPLPQQQQHMMSMTENDQQQKQPLAALWSPEAIVAAFCRALNAGRMVNLAQRPSIRRDASAAEEMENVPEEETSFIVVNSAEEMTEEFAFNSNNKGNPSSSLSGGTVVVKCCERGVEATDERCRGTGGGTGKVGEELVNVLEWMLWRSGVEIRCFGTFLLSLRQFLPLASVSDVNYASHELRRRFEEGQWATLSTPTTTDQQNQHVSPLSHMIELLIPKIRVRFLWHDVAWQLETDSRMAARLLSLLTGAVDDLLEDAYPQLGTRFILSPQGRPLVDRLIPCDRCAIEAIREEERYWLRENINRNPAGRGGGQAELPPRLAKSKSTKFKNNNSSPKKASRVPKSKSSTETPLSQTFGKSDDKTTAENAGNGAKSNSESRVKTTASQPIYLFGVEECIWEARRVLKNVGENEKNAAGGGHKEQKHQRLECPRHGIVRWDRNNRQTEEYAASAPSSSSLVVPDLSKMGPDLLFVDLENEWAVPSVSIQRGKLVGRGAFGFVFTGRLAFVPPSSPSAFRKMTTNEAGTLNNEAAAVVALKQFEPVDPNDGNNDHGLAMCGASEQAAIRAFALKWQNDALEQVTRAYCTARQELCMLSELRHSHCTSMVAFCPSPMTLLMELAPHGSLNKLLADYRQNGQKLHLDTVQMSCLQIARALEYLHVQQHIIYRDLKSENVLVWRFPPPSEFSGRSAKKPSPRDVLVKLGDYGISRFSHPFGMCKGYGGTEGFMAPEIMRYNGEQEYSERADCFSFGMFIYELLTLKQPYEGQPVQQMKERILEAQRPAVGEKELLFGTNMLDLMIACWEERAERRPNSSQLVEICSAPEFSHLLDVALLREDENGSLCLAMPSNSVAALNYANEWSFWMPIERDNSDEKQPQKGQQQSDRKRRTTFALLKCNEFGWTEKKHISFQNGQTEQFSPSKKQRIFQQQQKSPRKKNITVPKITVIAQIYDEFVWTGDELGTLSIFEQDEHQLLMANSAAPLYKIDTIEMLEESSQSKTEKTFVHPPLSRLITIASSLSSSSAVRHIVAFRERRLVIVGLTVVVLLCRWHGRESVPQLICCIPLNPIPSLGASDANAAHLFSMAVLRSLSDWQLWTGHAAGHIFMHFISSATDRLTFSTSANHYAMAENEDFYQQQQQIKKHQTTAPPMSRSNVAFLVASNCTKNLVWSALDKDPRLFMWRDSQLQKTLNSAKILPVSESLSSMDNFSANFQSSADDGIGTGTQQNAFSVTALEVMDLSNCGTVKQRWKNEKGDEGEEEEQLLVGTSNGVVLIVRGIEMSPISAFRPFCSVQRIICCPPPLGQSSSSCRILQKELLHSSTKKAPLSTSQSNEMISPHSPPNTERHSSKKRSLLIEKSRSIMLKATGSTVAATAAGNGECQSQRPKISASMPSEEGKQQQMASDLRNAAVSAVDELCETVRSGMRGIFTSSESAEVRGTVADKGGGGGEAYFISIGKGYRPLLSRFVSSAELKALPNKHSEENCAIFFRSTTEWTTDQQKN
ncbi:hypothetical protein niasHS_007675 [Heterodera schachtii]|uniref:Non-specific serine/threonine protein kinase n=1 Tax=Heterodera schachtii TaxID=97005 RepID=A0ABD2JPC6_HETSC